MIEGYIWFIWRLHPSGLFAALPLTPLGSPSLRSGAVSRFALGSN